MQEETKSVTHFVDSCTTCPFKQPHAYKMTLEICSLNDDVFIHPKYRIQPKCPLKTQMHKFITK